MQGAANLHRRAIDQAHRIIAAIGHGHELAIPGYARNPWLLSHRNLSDDAMGIQIQCGHRVRSRVGNPAALSVCAYGNGIRASAHADAARNLVACTVDDSHRGKAISDCRKDSVESELA